MSRIYNVIALTLIAVLVACAATGDKDTIARLRQKKIVIKEEKIEGGLEKAMQSYERFLKETPESHLTPEAIRRLADLKIEKEYGTITGGNNAEGRNESSMSAPERAKRPVSEMHGAKTKDDQIAYHTESQSDFEKRAAHKQDLPEPQDDRKHNDFASDLERVSTRDAIFLYQKLLKEYPLYDRNDQVLYQMARAYEELGEIEAAMSVMDRLIRQYSGSQYIDEVQFRRAEYFFTRRQYLEAEEAYGYITKMGEGSFYYELALYKLGWTFYKQELYEEALHRFVALLDYKVAKGYDFAQTEDEQARKRTDDTFRVVSLSFSNMGGAESVVDYFSDNGQRTYEDQIYSHLGEFYFDKRRYADAASAYNAFISRNSFHKVAPNFHMRVIEIHTAGGFPSLVLDAKKSFASTYGLEAGYWKYFDPQARPDVLEHLKINLVDLAHHYHASYQDKKKEEDKTTNFKEALNWYQQYLASFPTDKEAPVLNYQLADLLFEQKVYGQAALEYEKTAYGYPAHEKGSQAGYAAVFAYREHLRTIPEEEKDVVKRRVVDSSLKFSETFPKHEKAAIVLGAAADDLYDMKSYAEALAAALKLITDFPEAQTNVMRAAWLVVGHASYEVALFKDAEEAYLKVLALLPPEDKSRKDLADNLAASIYKQGEQANAAQDYRAAADHFLRVGRLAPTSAIRPNAEYDAAAALIQVKDWKLAATVLEGFRKLYPQHELQAEVTKKIAFVYKEDGKLALAAGEFERIEREAQDDAIRREALQMAADLYVQSGDQSRTLEVYQRYVNYFPQPVEMNVEMRQKIADIFKERHNRQAYLKELEQIVAADAAAGEERTERTIFLASKAGLVLSEVKYYAFEAVQLKMPFEENLHKKRDRMKEAVQSFNQLMDYKIGEISAAATYYLGEIYAHFNKSLMTSERPQGLSALEMEQYELAIEEQAYPFEERAIAVHESNLKLIPQGVYNDWIDKSLQKLAKSFPARYNKPEQPSGIVNSLDTYTFAVLKPVPVVEPVAVEQSSDTPTQPAKSSDGETSGSTDSPDTAEQAEMEKSDNASEKGYAKDAEAIAETVDAQMHEQVSDQLMPDAAAAVDPMPVEQPDDTPTSIGGTQEEGSTDSKASEKAIDKIDTKNDAGINTRKKATVIGSDATQKEDDKAVAQ